MNKQQYRVVMLHGGEGFSVLHPQGGSLGKFKTRKEAEDVARKLQEGRYLLSKDGKTAYIADL
jgi:hypothetical protein